MALRATPTIAICLTAGVAAGVALARPGDQPAPAAATPAPAAEPAPADGGGAYGSDQPAPASDPVAAPAAPAAPVAISIEGFAFSGATAAAPGSTLEVTNLDGAAHTLTSTDDAFNTGSLDGGAATAIVLPTAPGTYAYFCAFHPSMTGEIVVG